MSTNTIVQALVKTQKSLSKMDDYPGPAPQNVDAALALQDGVIATFGESVAGWKIGATNEKSQELLKSDGPFYGPIFASRLFKSGSTVKISRQSLAIIEPEIAFKLGRDITPRAQAYTAEEIFDAVESVHPALELIDRRLPGTVTDGVLWHIADCGLNDGLVYGPGDAHYAFNKLGEIPAEARLNGEVVASGVGANALGGAQFSAQWIANSFSQAGKTLRAGQFLTTGLITQVFTMAPGDTIEADFGPLGKVSVTIE